jgi:uncharacterized iron-regulated protein
MVALCWALLLAVAVTGSSAEARLPDCAPFAGAAGPKHPLACRAYAADGSEVEWGALVERLGKAPILLLGEVHDNADHHRIRAQLLLALAESWGNGSKAALIFEHIGADQEPALAALRAPERAASRDPSDVLAALDWEKSGWPSGRLFLPLFAAALDVDWPILPGNGPRQQASAITRDGLSALAREEMERLGLGEALPAPLQSALIDELEASHCGLVPRSTFATMADAQRYRDAHMARALADATATYGRALLLAGNGHVRSDRGVPWHLKRMAPDKPFVSVLLLEVEDAKAAPGDYVEKSPDGAPIADYVVLAPRSQRADPCVEMKMRSGR